MKINSDRHPALLVLARDIATGLAAALIVTGIWYLVTGELPGLIAGVPLSLLLIWLWHLGAWLWLRRRGEGTNTPKQPTADE
ncbi:hypothetical protein [Streptomyces sp. NPDC096153]|uniref:hypothetical protein n=1 Tax=Streptomyces sp. NPDC096153 TaxID=3155548 RepID=UPI003331B7C0